MRTRKLLLSTIAAIGLAVPATASAATTSSDSDVTGVAGAELSLAVGTPALMTLTHATPATATSLVDVISTSTSWTLSIADQSATTPGQMDKVDCITRAALGGSLANPLQWSVNATDFFDLSGTAATVATGSLVDAKTITYKQALGASEDIAVDDCWELTTTLTVTG